LQPNPPIRINQPIKVNDTDYEAMNVENLKIDELLFAEKNGACPRMMIHPT